VKRFAVKTLSALLSFMVSVVICFAIMDVKGITDATYRKFTSKGQTSLVVGTSRAAQGILPRVLNDGLSSYGLDLPIFNFSFNVAESPYGEIYYHAIQRKLGGNTAHNSLSIVCVDPFAISDKPDELKGNCRREIGGMLDRIKRYYRPNFSYLFRYCYPREWKNMHYEELQDDGWLRINAEMDSISVSNRKSNKKDEYTQISIIPSPYRMDWLRKTIQLLKTNGLVILVRIPTSSFMNEWEDKQWPCFSDDMKRISEELEVIYIDFSDQYDSYETTDGNHLYKDAAADFSSALCDSIRLYL